MGMDPKTDERGLTAEDYALIEEYARLASVDRRPDELVPETGQKETE